MSFRSQVANSAMWLGLSTVVIKILSFITITLVLARVLQPADFGVVGIAWLAMNALDYFREMGIASALTYRQDDDDSIASDVAFITLLISSVAFYLVIYAAAPAVQYFFRDAQGVTPVLRVLALTTLINGISQTPYTLLAKELNFRNKAIPEIIGGIGNSIVAIGMALSGFGVWSLVGGYLTDAVLRSSLVWFFTRWRPRWRFDGRVWREMIGYGKHIVGSRLLIFGITNIDDAFIGRFLGAAPFGFYTLAYRLSNVPATHVTGLINNLMFPAFSKIQNDREHVRRVYFQTIHAVALITIPLSIGTLVLGPTFVHEYYLGKWDGAIVAMQWLVIYGLMRSIAANMGNIYRALGKPQWLTYLAMWRFFTMLILLYPAIRWAGIVGVSMLSAVVAVVDFLIAAWIGDKLLHGGYADYFRHLLPTLLSALISAGLAYWVMPYLPAPHRLLPVLIASLFMVLVYGGFSWWRDAIFRRLITGTLLHIPFTRGLATRLGA